MTQTTPPLPPTGMAPPVAPPPGATPPPPFAAPPKRVSYMAVAGLVIGYASVALQILAVIFLVASAILGPCAEHTHHFHWHHW